MVKILIIDDDNSVCDLMDCVLKRAGYEVITAGDGDAGLAICHTAPVDLVITDLIMPGKEGLETIMELRRDFPEIKVIAMSGGGRVEAQDYLKIARGLGAAASLSKPADKDTLLTTIREVLGECPSSAKD